jgi:beta-1,4-mannosyltransferase
MRVTLFARVNPVLNPYILLYKETLERQGLIVHLEREFNLSWLMTRWKSCDAIHLHWIGAAYRHDKKKNQSGLAKKLSSNCLYRILRGGLRLASFSAAFFLAKLQGKIVVYTVHNLNPHYEQSRPFTILNRIAHHLVLSVADNVHVHNHYTRKVLETTYKRKDSVTVVPLGNYIGRYPNQISKLEARRQLGLPDNAFVYLSLGLLRPYKGVEDLVDAFEKLESPIGRLLIVGRVSKASYKEKLSSLVQNNPDIKLVPEFIPDEAVQLYMNACDICVLPYKDVTTSSAAVLALSFGRPTIAPAIASFPELITPETGILYDPSQPNALVSALRQARQRPWSESEILAYAHQFDWDKLGPQLAKLYQIACDRQRQPEITSGKVGHTEGR